ncbi:MAG: HlyD family efflux transporter periplasmic adaptor subunit [Methylococcales bacterium]
MTEALLSPQWYRVQSLTPHLQKHIEVHRHRYRGQLWFIVEDKSSGKHHRFNAAAFQFIGLLDGVRSVEQVWQLVNENMVESAPTQNEVIALLGQLHQADLLQSDTAIDTDEFFQRQTRHNNQQIKQTVSNPLSLRLPLWDPEQFLVKHLSKVSWIFHWTTALLWLLLITLASFLTAMHWQELSYQVQVNTFTPYNLILLFILYPLIKGLHELGHAFATKIAGGEVHEMGINLLLLVPVPYVNVSSSAHFRSKFQRMLVSVAGISVELFLAALSLILWLNIEPGLVRDIAFNVLLIGGISSLFFNGNPLLKYDGYYILADALDIPNLYQRSNRYMGYLAQRYLFGLQQAVSPAYAPGESSWFVAYSVAAFIYRIWVFCLISLFVIDKYFVIGLILAFWLISVQFLLPLYRILHAIVTNETIKAKSWRVIGTGSLTIVFLGALIFLVPFPSYTNAQGVVWLPEHAQLRVDNPGFVEPLSAASNTSIQAGTEVVQLTDPFLETQVNILRAKINELEASYRAEKTKDLVKAQILREQIPAIHSELTQAEKKLLGMQVKSTQTGRLLIPDAEDLPGQYLKQGDLIGYVIDNSKPTVRAAVTQADIGKLRNGILAVQVRLANQPDQVLAAKIIRETPEATEKLYSEALASNAGGQFILDPNKPEELLTLEKFFQVDVEFSPPEPNQFIGTRAYVRFYHGGEPLAKQWARSIRQLFLRQFNV